MKATAVERERTSVFMGEARGTEGDYFLSCPRIMREPPTIRQWAEWRSADLFPARGFPRGGRGTVALPPLFVGPKTDCCPRFEMKFLENVLHMFLNCARAAPENFSDLAVTFPSRDPFDDFEFALGQGARSFGISGRALVYSGCLAVPGGHGKTLLAEGEGRVHTPKSVCLDKSS